MTQPKHAGRIRLPRHWPVFLFALPAAVAIWSGWVGLGQMAGFGIVHPLPGIVSGFKLNTAITLPVGVEAYGAYALGAWLNPDTAATAKTFARRSAIGALVLGVLGQVSYHLLAADHAARAPWLVTVGVSCMPVVTLGFGAALTHLLRAGEMPAASATAAPAEAIVSAAPEATGSAIAEAMPEPAAEPEAVPAAEPKPEPRKATPGAASDPDAKAARDAYRKSKRAGTVLTDRALGEMFGRSRTWGASRIRETEGGPQLARAQ